MSTTAIFVIGLGVSLLVTLYCVMLVVAVRSEGSGSGGGSRR